MLCPDCWLLCEPPDPIYRCRHCFEEIDEESPLCKNCRQKRHLSVKRAYVFDPESPAHLLGLEETKALAGFAILQWIQLEWITPDAIVPMPDSKAIALDFAKFLDVPLVQALSKYHEYKEGRLEEDQILLLFDVSNSLPKLEKAALALMQSFPKKVYLLSLLPYVDFPR